jgi:hypothetical protein
MSHGNEMICQPVTLAGYAEWPKVADAVIEAEITIRKSQGRSESGFANALQHKALSTLVIRVDADTESARGQFPGYMRRRMPF